MSINKDKLMELQTTREMANDQIWEITEELQNTIENRFKKGVEIQEIDIWPEDGIEFRGSWLSDGLPWNHVISWNELE